MNAVLNIPEAGGFRNECHIKFTGGFRTENRIEYSEKTVR